MPQRVLVTGSSGFVGRHLARRLRARGDEVHGLDLVPPPADLATAIEHHAVDLREGKAVVTLLSDIAPEVIYHLGARSSVAVSMREPGEDVATNVLGTLQLALAAAEAGVGRLVFTSSGGTVYGPEAPVPASEAAALHPQSVYGASKASAELYLGVVAQTTALEVSILRPANIYGPEQDPHGEAGVVAIFGQRMLAGAPVTIFGDGSQTRDYLYIDDAIEALLTAAATSRPATCNVGTGVETSTGRIFELLAALTGYERAPVRAEQRPGDVARVAVDPARARELWGWAPRVALEDGLARTVEWFRAHPRA